jgi:hypothetical protein
MMKPEMFPGKSPFLGVGSSHILRWQLPLPLLAVVALGSGVTLSLVNFGGALPRTLLAARSCVPTKQNNTMIQGYMLCRINLCS